MNPLLGKLGFENSRVRLSRAGSIGRRCTKGKVFFRTSGVSRGWALRASNFCWVEARDGKARFAGARSRFFSRIVWLPLVLWFDACKAFLWVWNFHKFTVGCYLFMGRVLYEKRY